MITKIALAGSIFTIQSVATIDKQDISWQKHEQMNLQLVKKYFILICHNCH